MTKEKYFKTEWKSVLDNRAVDKNGYEYYYPGQPFLMIHFGEWLCDCKPGVRYDPDDVKDWWHESLQTKEQYLQLQNQANA